MKGKEIYQETERLILGFLRLKFSERLIINELKKLKISVSKDVIFRIKQKIFGSEKTKENKINKRKKNGRKSMFTGKDMEKLKRMALKDNSPTQRHMAKVMGCSASYVNYLINN